MGMSIVLPLTWNLAHSLGAVDSEFCVDFTNDEHAITCMGFDIPIAGTSAPTCTASYGGKPCECTIDDDFCVSLDCSEHNADAVVNTCEMLSWEGADASSFIPRFQLPGTDEDTVVS